MKRHRENTHNPTTATTTTYHPIYRIRNPTSFNVRLLFVIIHAVGANASIPSINLSEPPSLIPTTSLSNRPSTHHSNAPSISSSDPPSILDPSTSPSMMAPPPFNRIAEIAPTPSPNQINLSPLIVRPAVEGISMELSGIAPLSPTGVELYEKLTKEHIEWYFNIAGKGNSTEVLNGGDLQNVLSDVEVAIKVIEIDPPYVPVDEGGEKDEKDAGVGGDIGNDVPLVPGGGGVGVDDEGGKSQSDGSNGDDGNDGNDGNNGNNGNNDNNDNNGDDAGSGNETKNDLNLRRSLSLPQQLRYDSGNNNRNLEVVLTVTYQQITSFRYNGDDLDNDTLDESIIKEPFDNISKRIKYRDTLKDEGGIIFKNLDVPTLPEVQIEEEDPEVEEPKLNVIAILASVLGGVGVFIIMGIIYLKFMRDETRRPSHPLSLPDIECNTLETDRNGGVLSPDSIAEYPGRDPSVATIDEDYENRFPGTVSSSGGTVGSTARQSRYSGADSILTPGNLTTGTQSIYTTDDASFEAHLRGPGQPATRDDVFDVLAPPGKLGVVIDTPNSGAPVVYNIKENCPIADQLKVGDKVIFVDDEDVRSMTAVKVSRLISQKSANPTRKFTIMRTINT